MSNQQIVIAPPSMPYPAEIGRDYGIGTAEWRVLVDQIFPGAKEPSSIAMALAYCQSRKLDIFKKPVHIVPMYSSILKKMVETVWPGIAEIRTTATRTGAYAGIDDAIFGPTIDEEFIDEETDRNGNVTSSKRIKVSYPEWCKVTVHRIVQGHPRAFNAKVFWTESYATKSRWSESPNAMWQKRPFGQLEKVAEAAALRKAFPEELGSVYAAEEMEGRTIDHDPLGLVRSATSGAPAAPAAPAAPSAPAAEESGRGEIVDAEFERVDEAEERDEPEGDEDVNPEEVFKDAEYKLGLAKSLEDHSEIWSGFEHYAEVLFPPDWQHLASIGKRHEGRIERDLAKASNLRGG